MREIKFRAWDKDIKKMLEVNFYQYIFFQYLHYTYPQDNTLMQFTGLFDKEGKEIYEGDIVIEGYKGKYGTYEVKWNVKGFNLGSEDGDEYEVIGNIYENPELLERSK